MRRPDTVPVRRAHGWLVRVLRKMQQGLANDVLGLALEPTGLNDRGLGLALRLARLSGWWVMASDTTRVWQLCGEGTRMYDT